MALVDVGERLPRARVVGGGEHPVLPGEEPVCREPLEHGAVLLPAEVGDAALVVALRGKAAVAVDESVLDTHRARVRLERAGLARLDRHQLVAGPQLRCGQTLVGDVLVAAAAVHEPAVIGGRVDRLLVGEPAHHQLHEWLYAERLAFGLHPGAVAVEDLDGRASELTDLADALPGRDLGVVGETVPRVAVVGAGDPQVAAGGEDVHVVDRCEQPLAFVARPVVGADEVEASVGDALDELWPHLFPDGEQFTGVVVGGMEVVGGGHGLSWISVVVGRGDQGALRRRSGRGR